MSLYRPRETLVLLCAFLALSLHPPSALAADPKPNLILISLDTLRADHLGAYGYERNTSPKIDAFAKQAVLFERAIAPSSWTLPSHASVLTGLNPSEHGAVALATVLSEDLDTLPELAADYGYRTAGFTGGGNLSAHYGFAQGFSQYSVITDKPESTFDSALEWIDSSRGEPFFLFLHTYEIHEPYAPPAAFAKRFVAKDSGDLPASMRSSFDPNLRTERDRKHLVDLYDGGIAYTDDALGTFFEQLRGRGLWEESVIVLFSDHGEEFWDHGGLNHGMTLYDEQLHVPLIVKLAGTGAPTGRRSEPVPLKDIYPTLAQYLRWEHESVTLGNSFLSLLEDPSATGYKAGPIVSEVGFRDSPMAPVPSEPRRISIRMSGEKFIHNGASSDLIELFNLVSDPGESTNLAPSSAKRVEAFTHRMNAYVYKSAERAATLRGLKNPPAPKLDDETVERLRALGYLE